MLLTKDEILETWDLAFEDVEVPEWGGTVRVQAMSVGELEAFMKETSDDEGRVIGGKFRSALLRRSIVAEDRLPLFTAGDIAGLDKKSPKVISRLLKAARDLNGFSREVQEDLEKK